MKVYAVGGWVRDQLLSADAARSNGDGANRDRSDRPDPRQRSDRDWVVVGARAEDLVAAGYRPVGRDFPVFLHPVTHEEYALARTERKTAPGYHGFVFHAAPDVTLEQDLARRDLTINAIARAEDGTLIDPYGGRRDLAARVLRHIGPAFAEDPVRILRVARFAGRWPDFTLAPETLALMFPSLQPPEPPNIQINLSASREKTVSNGTPRRSIKEHTDLQTARQTLATGHLQLDPPGALQV